MTEIEIGTETETEIETEIEIGIVIVIVIVIEIVIEIRDLIEIGDHIVKNDILGKDMFQILFTLFVNYTFNY